MQNRFQQFAVLACTLLCAATISLAAHAQSKEPTQAAALPDTPVGRMFGKFLKAFNSGDLETMKRFHRENGGNEANAEKDMGAYQQTGGLTFHSVKKGSDYEIEALMQTKQGSQWLSFTVQVEETAPHPISRIAVHQTEAPGESKSSTSER